MRKVQLFSVHVVMLVDDLVLLLYPLMEDIQNEYHFRMMLAMLKLFILVSTFKVLIFFFQVNYQIRKLGPSFR